MLIAIRFLGEEALRNVYRTYQRSDPVSTYQLTRSHKTTGSKRSGGDWAGGLADKMNGVPWMMLADVRGVFARESDLSL
jgi:hypothetical protein